MKNLSSGPHSQEAISYPSHSPTGPQTTPDNMSGVVFYYEQEGGEHSLETRKKGSARAFGQMALGLLESAQMITGAVRRRHPRTVERMDEIGDYRVYTGEATGLPRNVRLLGREFSDNGTPVVVTHPLAVKFPGYIETHVTSVCESIKRPMLVVGSVGFTKDFVSKSRFKIGGNHEFHPNYMATDVHSILDQIESGATGENGGQEWPKLGFKHFDCTGASQGAMLGLELAAQAKHFGREMDTAALVAPAGLGEALHLGSKQLLNLMSYLRQFSYREFVGVCQYLSKADEEERNRFIDKYLETLPVPRPALSPVATTAIEILKGPMRGIGKALYDSSPSTHFNILLLDGDSVSTPKLWRDELGALPNVRINHQPGRHIAGIIRTETNMFVSECLSRPAERVVS